MKETLEKSWEVETLKAVLVQQEVKPVQQKDYLDVLHAPYVKGFSESLQRKLKSLQIGNSKERGNYTKLCRRVEPENWKHVVYAI